MPNAGALCSTMIRQRAEQHYQCASVVKAFMSLVFHHDSATPNSITTEAREATYARNKDVRAFSPYPGGAGLSFVGALGTRAPGPPQCASVVKAFMSLVFHHDSALPNSITTEAREARYVKQDEQVFCSMGLGYSCTRSPVRLGGRVVCPRTAAIVPSGHVLSRRFVTR